MRNEKLIYNLLKLLKQTPASVNISTEYRLLFIYIFSFKIATRN